MVVRRYARFVNKHKRMNRLIELLVLVGMLTGLGLAVSFESIFALLCSILGLPLLVFFARVQSYRNKFLGG